MEQMVRQLAAKAAAFNKPNYFSGGMRKGENFELKAELNSEWPDRRKDAVKRVIANMTIGKDVSSLFADVVKCMQTEDIELKKLVYLYLINYAKSQPELVILAVNTFVKDTEDHNPLIRALAIRTMGLLGVEKIIDYISNPLKKALKDDSPYVRKTAAIAVAKLYQLAPQLAIDNGFVARLQEMLSDNNPMVIANAVVALAEINDATPTHDVFVINSSILNKLLAALNDCTEWGQIYILTCLAEYQPQGAEAESIVEKVIPRLQHANPAVVLAAIRVLMTYFNYVHSEELTKLMTRKLGPCLVTLLSSEPEIQYTALRNIEIILQKKPEILTQDIRVFFCKYNEPAYVKIEKLEMMVRLCTEKNVDQVLSELKEYANEVDVDFVRRSIRAIGRVAIKVEPSAERCVNVLMELVQSKVSHVVQESIIVIKDIFRRYPGQFDHLIPSLFENVEQLDDPDAKAALIWIIGEYVDQVSNADGLLRQYLEGFKDEAPQVQLQLLTSTVKWFLKRPSEGQNTVQQVLQVASQQCENPDLRDRAYVYWRLLSTNPKAAKSVVLSEKAPIEEENTLLKSELLDALVPNVGTLASVYHKTPASLGSKGSSIRATYSTTEGEYADGSGAIGKNEENLLDLDFDDAGTTPSTAVPGQKSAMDDLLDSLGPGSFTSPPMPGKPAPVQDLLADLGGLSMTSSPTKPADPFSSLGGLSSAPVSVKSDPLADLLGGGVSSKPITPSSASVPKMQTSLLDFDMGPSTPTTPAESKPSKTKILSGADGKGLEVSAGYTPGKMYFTFVNNSSSPMTDFAIQFNKNTQGLVPSSPLSVPSPLRPGSSVDVVLPLAKTGPAQQMNPPNLLQIAIKNNQGVYYMNYHLPQ